MSKRYSTAAGSMILLMTARIHNLDALGDDSSGDDYVAHSSGLRSPDTPRVEALIDDPSPAGDASVRCIWPRRAPPLWGWVLARRRYEACVYELRQGR